MATAPVNRVSTAQKVVEAPRAIRPIKSYKTEDRWTKDSIAALIADANAPLLLKMLGQLYDRQTDAERRSESTHENNRVGFSRFDADFLTRLYQRRRDNPMSLTFKEDKSLRLSLQKYRGQLAEIANAIETQRRPVAVKTSTPDAESGAEVSAHNSKALAWIRNSRIA